MSEIVSVYRFAQIIGVNESSVRKAIKSGRLSESVIKTGEGKTAGVNVEAAKAEWARNHNPEYQRTTKSGKHPGEDDTVPTDAKVRSLADLKRLQAEVNLQASAIELRKKKGELVERKKVYAELFTIGQEMRTVFQALPDRAIDRILAAASRNEAHTALVEAINEALTQVAEIGGREILKQ